MATPVAAYVCTEEFKRVLKQLSIAEQEPQLLGPPRMLSSCQPFPWSRKVHEADHCVLNMVPCDNEFELAFSKLPQPFGFSIDYTDAGMNLRSYYPDFVAVDTNGTHWLIETKGAETAEVVYKDSAAKNLVRKRDGAGRHEVAVFGDTLESV
jgi:type III restriction enzyme